MIALKDLNFSYPKMENPLFNGIQLNIRTGTICGMLGPNGSGKSTLLKLLAGLLIPDSGNCEVLEFIPSERHPDFLSEIFLLPEEIFVPGITAQQYEKRYAPFYPDFDPEIFAELLKEFQLAHDRKLNTLSQGQKKKFLLAFGIATNTRLLIMDEPSNGLDIPSKSQFRKVLVRHFAENRTFIISTHQVHDLEGLVDSVMILSEGSLLLNKDLETISSHLLVSKEYSQPEQALYYEESLNGYDVVRENRQGEETRIDLALLFGFVTSNSDKASSLLEGELNRE